MKPLMGQVQSQANLDDLLGSPQAAGGNFSRPRVSDAGATKTGSRGPSFSELLLKNLNKDTSKPAASKNVTSLAASVKAPQNAQKPENIAPKAERPQPPTMSKQGSFKAESIKTDSGKEDKINLSENSSARDTSRPVNKSIENVSLENNSAQSANALNTKGSQDLTSAETRDTASSKAALAPLKKQVSEKLTTESVLSSNAILAFITGRLDKIEPETLPSLINESQLIKQTMTSGDVAKFMESPMSIGDLARLLEIDQSLLNKAAKDGLDATQIVKPKEFINALGLDASRVTAELTLLQQKLPTEGIQSYIDRAKSLSSLSLDGIPGPSDRRDNLASVKPTVKQGLNNLANTGDTASNSALKDETPAAIEIQIPQGMAITGQLNTNLIHDAVSFNTSSDQKIELNEQDIELNNHVNVPNFIAMGQSATKLSSLSETSFNRTSELPMVDSKPSTRQKDTDAAEQLIAESLNGNFNLMTFGTQTGVPSDIGYASGDTSIKSATRWSAINNNADKFTANAPMFEAMDLEIAQEIAQEITQEIAQDIDLQITSVETLKDPFLALAQELDPATSSKIDFGGNGIQHRSLEELLIDRGLAASSPSQIKSGEVLKSEMIDSSSADIQPTIDAPMKANEFADGAIELAKSTPDQLNASTFGEQKGDGQGFEQDLDQGAGDTLRDLATPIVDGFKHSRDTKVSFANKLASADVTPNRESISAKILGHAQMMVKNGGGSMRVDVEAPGIGKVDVAINLINNQLDVRIITSSEQARDIIAKEVAGLRDGLTQQGISLRGLEVGKAGDSSPRHFSGQGHQQFGQGAQDQRATYNDMKEYVQSFKNSYTARPSQSAPPSVPSLGRWTNLGSGIAGNSRLEVRV